MWARVQLLKKEVCVEVRIVRRLIPAAFVVTALAFPAGSAAAVRTSASPLHLAMRVVRNVSGVSPWLDGENSILVGEVAVAR